jgi:hypothetical protein
LIGKSFHTDYQARHPSKGVMNGVFATASWIPLAMFLDDAPLEALIYFFLLYLFLTAVNPEGTSLVSLLKRKAMKIKEIIRD